MGISRYPRRGHRLAPATLRPLLQVPVPAKYLKGQQDARLQLCDLDETAWERFDHQTCQALAGEVVRAVGRAARMPIPIGEQRLPPIRRGMKLADLELEARTFNCLVSAGIHQRPQDLRTITIEGVLGLRGFWVKCLVDLLTSLEYVTDHPEARRTLRTEAAATIRSPRDWSRYPRKRCPLAPKTLREILTDPIPSELGLGTPVQGLRLCDLDDRIWSQLSPELVVKLADLIVSRVNVSGHNRAIQGRRLPKPPKGMRLEDLRLENRTHRCLRRAGFGQRPEDLGKRTVGELLSIKAFGAKCLVDLLSSLEVLASREGKFDKELTAEAKALGNIPGALSIHFSDPRLGPMLRATDAQADTVAELVSHIIKRRLDPPDPVRLYEQICQLRRRVSELTELSLQQELTDVFSPPLRGPAAPAGARRDKQIVAEYYGWDGSGGHTLEELGQNYGLSRERIRQVCVRAIKRNRQAKVFAPVLDRALGFIAERLPTSAEKLRAEFDAASFSACRLSLEPVRKAAEFLSRKPQFVVVRVGHSQLVVGPDSVQIPQRIVQVAKRAVLSYGATTINDVAAELRRGRSGNVAPALIEETLQTLSGFRWLDRKRGWFKLESPSQYGLPHMIRKILSVTGQIEVSKLRSAIARYRRASRKVLPARALLEFCRQMSGTRVEGNKIIAHPPLDRQQVLLGVEAGMVRVLIEHGPVMERGAFEEHCIRDGINRFSFNAMIMCSPLILQYGRSLYGLLGAKVGRKTVRSLAARKPATASAKVLRDYGWTDKGQVYLVYQLSKAAISGGVLTVPAAMKEKVRGKFTIRTPDGREAGTLVSKNGCAWGLGPALRGQGAEPGDYLLILLDASQREALIRIGDEKEIEN